MKIRNLFALIALMISTAALADDSVITFDGGTAKPGKTFTLVMDKLAGNIHYNLSCAVHGDGNGYRKNSIQVIGSDKIQMILVNREDVSATDGNADLKFPLNSLKALGVYKGAVLMVRNINRYDDISILDCNATPISS